MSHWTAWEWGSAVILVVLYALALLTLAIVIGRYRGRRRLLAEMDALPLCAQGCGRVATHERFEDATADGTPIVALVCHRHAGDGRPR